MDNSSDEEASDNADLLSNSERARTQAGKPAKGPTADEFKDFISNVKAAYAVRCAAAGIACRPIWSWDNPRIHGSVEKGDWESRGITTANHTQLPTYSPDMHNVIETSHALICAALQKGINDHKPAPSDTLAVYTDMLQGHLKRMLTPEWGLGAVKRLFSKTLPAIISAEGRYPLKYCR
ncbi:hypothetical protein TSOC_010003 [Tetrabaena socialis]|uniref:Uncharacterized protein n=1 Tax=Tetrabaena socialis TaxID=47790 RepID=A0A2J7ZUF0_9CHLO|nr:hypothetical protein TSOC_010003 [Tetrabaena socialis]|eukprot:PNH03894.1 hypothetical protein TSOC_010003 [Tetrabaena socialis]